MRHKGTKTETTIQVCISAFERLKLLDSFNEGPQRFSICKRDNTNYC